MTGQLLTAEQLAERWQVPTSQVYRLTRDGKIPAVKLGRYYRFSPTAIERFENGETTTKETTNLKIRQTKVRVLPGPSKLPANRHRP